MGRPPRRLHEFVGLVKIQRRIETLLAASRKAGEAFPHLLLTGPEGLGKTLLARIVAGELGVTCSRLLGAVSREHLRETIAGMQVRDLLFIDEAHTLTPAGELELLDLLTSDGDSERYPHQGRITVVLATNRPGRLSPALRNRFGERLTFQPYELPDMRAIVGNVATKLELLVKPHAMTLLAQISHGTPRIAEHTLQSLRRYLLAHEYDESVDVPAVRNFMREVGLDAKGLNADDRRLLRCLRDASVLSRETLSGVLRMDWRSVSIIELRLLPLGFVVIESGGRRITRAGVAWLDENAALDREEA